MCDFSCMERNKHAEQKCNVCQKIFGTSLEVLQHVASEHLHDDDPEVDEIMLKESDKSTQEEVFEENSSEGKKWLVCDICDFKSKKSKNQSIKNHMNSKHKKCKSCEFCGKYFKSNKSLLAH